MPQQIAPERGITDPVRVFVVDDHDSYRSLVAEVITAVPGFESAGGAGSWDEARQSIATAADPPDLVLMDVNLGNDSGISATVELLESWPSITVMLISTLADDELPPHAASCGAACFLSKSELSPKLIDRSWRAATGAS